MTMKLGPHISQQYNEELEDIRNQVLTMGGLVEQQLADAVTALMNGDSELGHQVVTRDYKVNSMEVAIDEGCSRVLARRQPAASDLRLIVAVIKTITDLERIGDQAERVASNAVRLAEGASTRAPHLELQHLGVLVREMLHGALDAFARMDPEAAVEVVRRDIRVDQEYESVMRQLITFMMEDPRTITPCTHLLFMAKNLERIGDHATNIAENAWFLLHGEPPPEPRDKRDGTAAAAPP